MIMHMAMLYVYFFHLAYALEITLVYLLYSKHGYWLYRFMKIIIILICMKKYTTCQKCRLWMKMGETYERLIFNRMLIILVSRICLMQEMLYVAFSRTLCGLELS